MFSNLVNPFKEHRVLLFVESLRVYSLKGSSSCKYDEIPC